MGCNRRKEGRNGWPPLTKVGPPPATPAQTGGGAPFPLQPAAALTPRGGAATARLPQAHPHRSVADAAATALVISAMPSPPSPRLPAAAPTFDDGDVGGRLTSEGLCPM